MHMKKKVYVETSVISNLTSRLSNRAENRQMQLASREWWEHRNDYELVISQYVKEEIQAGDKEAADRRVESVEGIPVLPPTTEAVDAARELVRMGAVPAQYLPDALHITVAAHYGVDYIVTWNQKHLSGNTQRKKVENALAALGLKIPKIVRPGFQEGDKYETSGNNTRES